MTIEMDEPYASALRQMLVEQVAESSGTASRFRWPRRWAMRVGVAVAVLGGGGGGIAVATAALWSGLPGSRAISELAPPVTITGDGTETVQLGPPPAGANAVYIQFSCLSAGDFRFPDGSSEICDGGGDVSKNLSTYTLPLKPGLESTAITTDPGNRWRLTATYVSATITPWALNASGQTYGVVNGHGSPDLVSVIATNHRVGYVYANQLQGPIPASPRQAVAENGQQPRVVTVYESDGKTPIGKFNAGK